GCGAALPNLRTAAGLIASGCENALCICVEICSAAFYLDNDLGVLVSGCLFGDGAAAAVVSPQPTPGKVRMHWSTFETSLCAEDRDYLKFEQKNGMLRNILTPQVPRLAAKHAETVLARVLARRGLRPEQISAWIMHAGGREVLKAM